VIGRFNQTTGYGFTERALQLDQQISR